MGIESSPAFQFYVKEWRSSRAIMRMSYAQRGMYLEMLLEQWENLTLPDDPAEVAELIGGSHVEWTRNWAILRRKFVTDESSRIYNIRLEQERNKQKGRNRRQSDKGKAGAAARWQKHGTGIAQASPGHASADSTGISRNSFAFPIAIPIATADTQASEDVGLRAGDLLRKYRDWYEKERGAKTVLVGNSVEFQDAVKLVETWDDARLEKLARIVLTTDDDWIAKTGRGFKIFCIKASWADDRLSAWEAQQEKAV